MFKRKKEESSWDKAHEAMERDRIIERIRKLEKQVFQLNCPHEQVKFEKDTNWNTFYPFYEKRCEICGRTLETFSSEKEFLESQIEFAQQKLNDLEE